MSQPFSRSAKLPPVGSLDRAAGQFWVPNAWEIVDQGHNLSAFERKSAYLNAGRAPGEAKFANMSFVSGLDGDGDGRAAIAADLFGTGMQDLALRQAGGGPVIVYRNRFPQRHWLRVALVGTASNRQGIGAKLTAEVAGRKLMRELYPHNTYKSQQPAEVHFGLADVPVIDKLTIRWPSGTMQTLTAVKPNQRLEIAEPPAAAGGR